MSIDRWLSKAEDEKDNKQKREENSLRSSNKNTEISKEKLKELKIKKIRNITKKDKKTVANRETKVADIPESEFLDYLLDFKRWLSKRNYLRGDIGEIETWINNLYKKLQSKKEVHKKRQESTSEEIQNLREDFNKIPPQFLEEKIRIAINKKLRGNDLTSSNAYYLRKLKKEVRKKLKEAKYYKILKKILDF